MSAWQPGASRAALAERAALLARIRSYFAERDVLEVQTPVLASYGVSDPSIEPLLASNCTGREASRFLQSSPEHAMKRLLAAGSGAIYQLGPAFRAGEVGPRHNPEFTLLEWYRPGYSLRALMDEVGALVGQYLQRDDFVALRYGELFLEVLAVDPFNAGTENLEQIARARVDMGDTVLQRDGWLDLLMSHCIEPALADRGLCFVYDYPPSQAALARCRNRGGQRVADRFELYVDGVELANGYRELLDPLELVRRCEADNVQRAAGGLPVRELDPHLLAAMQAGLPDCSGVALGVDRLLMCRLGSAAIAEVLAFDWTRS
ncbi:MAG: lysyl-tRNA synthetase class 2 [Halieaceae bacterium]